MLHGDFMSDLLIAAIFQRADGFELTLTIILLTKP